MNTFATFYVLGPICCFVWGPHDGNSLTVKDTCQA